MATRVRDTERDFLFKLALDERLPVACKAGGGTWDLRLAKIAGTRLVFRHSMPLRFLAMGATISLRFVARSHIVAFDATVFEATETTLAAEPSGDVLKDLSRKFDRKPPPSDLAVSFSFKGERYALDFPATDGFEDAEEPATSPDFDPTDLRSLVQDFGAKAGDISSERGITLFRNRKPQGLEESLVVKTGRSYFNPNVVMGLPLTDPFPERRILIASDFVEHFAESGMETAFAEEEKTRFERSRRAAGYRSELAVPIRFHEYVLGIVRLSEKRPDRTPYDLGTLETFAEFARAFAYSLKRNGYFRGSPKRSDDYRAEVVDISAGGLMFALRDEELARALNEGSDIAVCIAWSKRTVNATARVRRRFRDGQAIFFASGFVDLPPEDFRFLFEYLYGRPVTDADFAAARAESAQ